MKNDARLLLNKKKWKTTSLNRNIEFPRGGGNVSHGTLDARKILNLKKANKVIPQKEIIRGGRKISTPATPIFKQALSSVSKVPEKRIKLSSDGNIIVTAKSKDPQGVSKSSQKIPSSFSINLPSGSQQLQRPAHHWVPADVDMDNLEHLGIDDLIDMESLPPAVVSPSVSQSRMLSRSLADNVLEMQNTMVADQVASTSSHQNIRVLVTNLRISVSKQDILELFGDVGLIKSAEMPQIGTAVIEFYDIEDATRACSTYHDRLLDGQPMKCYLQTNVNPQRSSIAQRLGKKVQSLSPVQSTSSFASSSRSRYNPRDVRFTVKLN